MRKKEEKLNGKTPRWFEQWHNEQFVPVRETAKGNKRWIYIIVAAIIADAISGSFGFASAIDYLVKACGG